MRKGIYQLFTQHVDLDYKLQSSYHKQKVVLRNGMIDRMQTGELGS